MKRVERLLMNSKSFTTTDVKVRSSVPPATRIAEGQLIVCKSGRELLLVTRSGGKVYKIPFYAIQAQYSDTSLKNSTVGNILDDVAELTDSSGGTADGTVAAISGSGDDADINNNFAELSSKVNSILSKLTEILDKFK